MKEYQRPLPQILETTLCKIWSARCYLRSAGENDVHRLTKSPFNGYWHCATGSFRPVYGFLPLKRAEMEIFSWKSNQQYKLPDNACKRCQKARRKQLIQLPSTRCRQSPQESEAAIFIIRNKLHSPRWWPPVTLLLRVKDFTKSFIEKVS